MRLWLGIDLGGTKTVLAIGDREGRVYVRRRRPTEPSGDPARDLERLAADARELLAEVEPGAVAAVGVAAPGPLDRERGAVLRPPNLPGWDDVPVRDALADALDLPVRLENDANAAALAEWRFGAGRGFRDVVYLTMSTGIGAGLVLDGRLHAGALGNAGEIGHMPVEWNGETCACGLSGCLEAYAGGAAWTRRLRARTPRDSRVAELAGGREQARPEHVVAAAREGDAFARAELDRFNDYLARGLTALVFVLAPQAIVLGTIPTAAGEELCLRPVREQVWRHVWPLLRRELHILPSGLGDQRADLAGLCVAFGAEADG